MRACIEQLLKTLGDVGPILVYSAFERTTLNNAALMFPDLAQKIGAVLERLVDLLPMVRRHYYHPAMKGSWSIKAVLPTVAPDLSYADLANVQDGGGAQRAYLEAIAPTSALDRKKVLFDALVSYCTQDTLAMVRLVEFLGADSPPS